MNTRWILLSSVLVALLILAAGLTYAQGPAEPSSALTPLGTGFTYQGMLQSSDGPVNGTCNFRFILWNAEIGGSQIGDIQEKSHVPVTNGLFTVQLDFGPGAFAGEARWLEIAVQCAGDDDYVPLFPRQPLTPAPYALFSASAPWSGLTGVPAGFADGVDNDSGGDITAVAAGTGLSGGGTSGAVSLALSSTYRLPQTCANGQIAKWNGSQWVCGDDDVGSGDFWSLTGNSGTTPGTNFLGTTDAVSLTLAVHGTPALRLQPTGGTPNLIGGYQGNTVADGVEGATIGGGGANGEINQVNARFATVGGGAGNTASGNTATVGGGGGNEASGSAATVGGGFNNAANGSAATVSGGDSNSASASYATVGGGGRNTASGSAATIGGGSGNTTSGSYATVGGGGNNTASDVATIAGGSNNTASGSYATVGGGDKNTASGSAATVSGGASNTASGGNATVGGGRSNTASGSYATVGGGRGNQAHAAYATIAGGGPSDPNQPSVTNNVVSDDYGTIGGGGHNRAGNNDSDSSNAVYATVSGGRSNTARGSYAAVGGGYSNTASDSYATVGGGNTNTASAYATVGGGYHNQASGAYATVGGGSLNTANNSYTTVSGGFQNNASGTYATVPGGYHNEAGGAYSFAAGRRAKTSRSGCFVWGDSTNADVSCNAVNRTIFRSTGGFYIYTNSSLSSGTFLSPGGHSWNVISDRATKEHLTPVDGQALLQQLAAMPVWEYNLKSQDPAIRHIGPVAQDFYAAFGYGESNRAINVEDALGVAFASIQELHRQNQDLRAENAALRQQVEAQQRQLKALEARVAALEQAGPLGMQQSGILPGAGVALLALGAALMMRRKGGQP